MAAWRSLDCVDPCQWNATHSACPGYAAVRASMSPAPPGFSTHRSASSRWISARRRAAGELAALVGGRAVPLDRDIRLHRFRAEAKRATELLSPADRQLLDAYTGGVNAGLNALGAVPFEYLVLRQTPLPWRPEDTFLVVLSMFITLQDTEGAYEATLATMYRVLPRELADFLAPAGTEWDAPITGGPFAMPAVPGPDIYDLRTRRRGKESIELPEPEQSVDGRTRPASLWAGASWPAGAQARRRLAPATGAAPDRWDALLAEWDRSRFRDGAIGSNNWAVSGRLTDGRPAAARQRHASGDSGAEYLVSRGAGMARFRRSQ